MLQNKFRHVPNCTENSSKVQNIVTSVRFQENKESTIIYIDLEVESLSAVTFTLETAIINNKLTANIV